MGFDGSPILKPRIVAGKSCGEFVRGKTIVVDSAGWVFEARSTARTGARNSHPDGTARWAKSAARLASGRIAQIESHGARVVVVLEGVTHPVMRAVATACEDAGVRCFLTPRDCEGECVCAQLVACGLADIVWTGDAYDTLLFGSPLVMRRITRGEFRGSPALSMKNPGNAVFEVFEDVHTTSQKQLRLFAACVGTDFYDSGIGVPGVGAVGAARIASQIVDNAANVSVPDNVTQALVGLEAEIARQVDLVRRIVSMSETVKDGVTN